jgi:ABC-type amino acid transport substrate-binding protein
MKGAFRIAMAWLSLALAFSAASAPADPVMTYIYHRDEGDIDVRNQYIWRMLRGALEHTRATWGDYVLEPSIAIHEKRRIYVLEHNEAGINVSLFPAQRGLDDRLVPVRIPVDRGLLGYRVLLIRDSDQAIFSAVRSLEDLKKIRFGLLSAWEDVPIMQNAGLTVVSGSSYEGLFRMLSAGRFDALSRSASEVLQEVEERGKDLPGVSIEKRLLLHYPMPAYFWFPNTEDGRRRAERVRVGLNEMIKDGSLRGQFDQEFGPQIKQLDLDHRLVLELSNPLLGGNDPLSDSSLWYRPGAH